MSVGNGDGIISIFGHLTDKPLAFFNDGQIEAGATVEDDISLPHAFGTVTVTMQFSGAVLFDNQSSFIGSMSMGFGDAFESVELGPNPFSGSEFVGTATFSPDTGSLPIFASGNMRWSLPGDLDIDVHALINNINIQVTDVPPTPTPEPAFGLPVGLMLGALVFSRMRLFRRA